MATRALIRIFDADVELCTIYKHNDGYPSNLGKILSRFCKDMKITQGVSVDTKKTANGMGCFAALLIGKLKDRQVGDIYLYPVGTKDVGQEYEYHIHQTSDGGVSIDTKSC